MTKINSYKELQNFLTKVITDNGQYDDTDGAPHGIFWEHMTYQQFTTGNVPVVGGGRLRILIPGNPDGSTLISILKAPFGGYRRMPAVGPPFFTDDQVASVADWISRNCPEN
jgi:hypothetical protein